MKRKMNMNGWRLVLLGYLAGLVSPAMTEAREWNFSVFLDDRKVGHHRFVLSPAEAGSARRLESRAEFDVSFLFFIAYSYKHQNSEVWNDGCLQRIDARTNANGKLSEVDGRREDNGFYLEAGSGGKTLEGCIRSFAYWNPRLLQADNLLNPQTGEYLDVQLERLGREEIKVSGRTVEAVKYRIKGDGGVDIALWYTPENEWLALESTLESGRVLNYRLEQE